MSNDSKRSAAERIEHGLAMLGDGFRTELSAAGDEQTLRTAQAKVLGKKGSLTQLLALMRELDAADRPRIGALVNAFKGEVEDVFAARLAQLAGDLRRGELEGTPHDLTLPGRLGLGRGHAHPIVQIRDEVLDVFRDLGFEVIDGPEVELDAVNFAKLAFPPDHPATDMQDSFWVDVAAGEAAPLRALLRTHTTTTQVRELLRRRPPMAVVSPGAVYRRDDDVTHSPMFHQIDGFLVDEDVSFAELKGVLTAFARGIYGGSAPVRFRPSYFPFVEPGAEVDVGCVFCRADDGTRARCRVCKATGWLEILGCGMIHPEVFEQCGLDPERYTGFAFGMGLERVAMLRFGIPSIKLLFDNDPRFLDQF